MKRFLCVLLICFVSVASFAKNNMKNAFKDLGTSLKDVFKETGNALKDFYEEMKPLFEETTENFDEEVLPLVNEKIKELEESCKKAKKEDLQKIQEQLQAMIDRLNEIDKEETDKDTKGEIDKSLEKLDKLNQKVSKKI